MPTPEQPGSAPSSFPGGLLPTWLHVSDIQGLAQLATQATLGVTGLAESVQGNVYKAVAAPFGPLGAKFIDRLPGASGVRPLGITGLVYGGIKGVTRLAGGTANALLSRAAPLAGPRASTPQREAMLSALNGVLGDRLAETANPLAISMRLRHQASRCCWSRRRWLRAAGCDGQAAGDAARPVHERPAMEQRHCRLQGPR
jgi:hypothetical protein